MIQALIVGGIKFGDIQLVLPTSKFSFMIILLAIQYGVLSVPIHMILCCIAIEIKFVDGKICITS